VDDILPIRSDRDFDWKILIFEDALVVIQVNVLLFLLSP
jgi:hypothetical protein